MIRPLIRNLQLLLAIALLAGCAANKPFYANGRQAAASLPAPSPATSQIFLIGDAGLPSADPLEPALATLQTQLEAADAQSAVIFLGDNIYPAGLPEPGHKDRAAAEKSLRTQLDILKKFKGRIIFVPGNHDWEKGKQAGAEYVARQEAFIESYLNRGNTFLPDGGCPGPVEIPMGKDLTLIVIDTQWWLQAANKPAGDDCDVKSDEEFLLQLKDMLLNNANKQVIVVGHHPMYSNGPHNGHTAFADHIFPLRNLNKKAYLPLPVLGSIYPFYRKFIGNIQDIPHERYQKLKQGLVELFRPYPGLIYAAGHEHDLQYFKKNGQHYIVSGAGSKTNYTARGKGASFAHRARGFARIDVGGKGEFNIHFIEPGKDADGDIVYVEQIKDEWRISEARLDSNYGKRHTVVAGTRYKTGRLGKMFFGEHYRKEWMTPVEVEVLDLDAEHGGLTPVKRGGGFQTKSLRLKGQDGKEYVLRSIDKDPSKALPPALRGSFAADILQDQISSSNPYAPLAVAPMAEAAGVYHTNPKLVWVPPHRRLGNFNGDFGGVFCLYEERPTGNQEGVASFGNSKNVVTSEKMYKKIFSDADDQMDQPAFIRTRLFDMWLGDWDRHEDQWVWATFKDGKKTLYRPIPRDRDQAFFRADGLIPSLAAKKWALRQTQHFANRIRDIDGLNMAGIYLDIMFTNRLNWTDWEKEIKTLQAQLTDAVIDSALRKMPPAIFALSGENIAGKLKIRRDEMLKWAGQYYRTVVKSVTITGTEEADLFVVNRLNNDETRVEIFKIKKNGETGAKWFEHNYLSKDTRDIILFAFDGNDRVELNGEGRRGPVVYIAGGKGMDSVVDQTQVSGGRKTKFYDKKAESFVRGNEAKLFNTGDSVLKPMGRRQYKFNVVIPGLLPGLNPDDGLVLGGTVKILRHRFAKKPMSARHSIKGTYAIATGAYSFEYEGRFTAVAGKWDLWLDGRLNQPRFVINYFGQGNETKLLSSDINYNRIRAGQVVLQTALSRRIGKFQRFNIGIGFLDNKIKPVAGRFVTSPVSGLTVADFADKKFGTLFAGWQFQQIDNALLPHRGMRLDAGASFTQNFTEKKNFGSLNGEAVFYIPLSTSTLSLRLGGARHQGEFEFYQSHTLGGTTNLRGYRRDRFAGRSSIYQNSEFRLRLSDLGGYVFKGQFGILAFADNGRVWTDGENSDKWHWGVGGGLWMAPFNMAALSATFGHSREQNQVLVRLGFLF